MIESPWWGEDVVPRIRWTMRVRGKLIGRQNEPGDRIPNGYGIAYFEACSDTAVIMPVPLNVIVGGLRALVAYLRFPPWMHYTARLAEAERRGRMAAPSETLLSSRWPRR